MEKSCPGKEGHPLSWINLSEYPLAQAKSWKSAHAHTDCLSLTELIQLGELKSLCHEKLVRLRGWLYSQKKENQLGRSPVLAWPDFLFLV